MSLEPVEHVYFNNPKSGLYQNLDFKGKSNS